MAIDIFDPEVKAGSKRSFDAGMWRVMRKVCDLFRKPESDSKYLYSFITDGYVSYDEAASQLEEVYRNLCESITPERWQEIIEAVKARSRKGW